MSQSVTSKLTTFGAYLVAGILVLLPFHALLSVWVGSNLGVYEYVRLWKELLLVVLLIITTILFWRDKALRQRLQAWPVFWLMLGYTALTVVAGVVALAAHQVSAKALLYGLTVNLRFILFFGVCAVLAAKTPWLRANWQKLLLVPAVAVIAFGLLQAFALPHGVLQHVGYGPDTIPAYQTVDQKPDYARVQSTLRGPNPLGAYLVLIIAGAVAVLVVAKKWARLLLGGLLVAALVVLGQTYSRSAYIGALVTLAVAFWMLLKSRQAKRWVLVGAAALVVAGGLAIAGLRQNDLVQNTFFHTDESSLSSHSSNQDRATALQTGLNQVLHQPLGRGPGTAGPASVYNRGQVRIAEDYYLQIGQEVGWLGLGLFVAILIAVGHQLYGQRRDRLAVVLFASLVGISIINLLSHAWADDTLSLLWWGLAGLCLSAILGSRNEAR